MQRPLVKHSWREFSGGPVVRNLPCNEGDTNSIAHAGRSHFPRGAGAQLSLCMAVTEPVGPGAGAPQQEQPVLQGRVAPAQRK